ncbi:MAG: S-methyl-5-thioribose-1-phosphate isomerase [Gemmatimonadetes bacterium]|nr:MAG: S-methyl-5-thioribose-1-phosphate isomerase [Gemmatimonadota bacterium]
MIISTIEFTASGSVRILDQRLLPGEETYADLNSVEEVAVAIETLAVRGAPLIGIAAAMGVALAVGKLQVAGGVGRDDVRRVVAGAIERLRGTRPTAVNLNWALDRMASVAASADADSMFDVLLKEAKAIHAEDAAMCRRIGEAGAPLVKHGATVITHCNAGALATGGIGTALAPIYLAGEEGRLATVMVLETRPLLQGARLTTWELARSGIPCTLMTDSMAASRLSNGDISWVIVGADRIAANGDVANKIGTLGLALLAKHYGVPFYVAAPSSTFDPATATGADIPIEQRAPEEVGRIGTQRIAADVPVWNPAFDVTPAELITAFITNEGMIEVDEVPGRAVTRSGGRDSEGSGWYGGKAVGR